MKFQIIKSNYLDQVHNKIFTKALHRLVKILKKTITNCHYHTVILCHVEVIKFSCLLIY